MNPFTRQVSATWRRRWMTVRWTFQTSSSYQQAADTTDVRCWLNAIRSPFVMGQAIVFASFGWLNCGY